MNVLSNTRRFGGDPAAVVVLALAAGLTLLLRFLPPEIRAWNLSPVGAMFLFAGARAAHWSLLLIPMGITVAIDLFLFASKGWELPLVSYLGFAGYVLLGAIFLRRSENPGRMALTALLGSVLFFAVTNTAFWLEMQINPALHLGNDYFCEATLAGWWKCHVQALPFFRGTLLGDLICSLGMLGAYAWAVRIESRAATDATPEENR